MAADVSPLIDQGASELNSLGTFWSGFYTGSGPVVSYCRARSEAGLQDRQALRETADCVGLNFAPAQNLIRHYPVVLSQSEKLDDVRLSYGDGESLGPPADFLLSTAVHEYPAPEGLRWAARAASGISSPAAVLTAGVDFDVNPSRRSLRFRKDPFADSRFAADVVHDELGNEEDRRITVWLYQAQFDRDYLWTHFGSVLGVRGASNEAYRRLLRGLWRGLMFGPARRDLDLLLSGVCDAPLTGRDGETVERIVDEPERRLVITDLAVYPCPLTANVLVTVGQVLRAGDRLTDAFEVIDMTRVPDPSILDALTLPVTMLRGSFTGGLTWTNGMTSVLVSEEGGRTRVEWSLGGTPADVELFWDTVHALGTAPGATSLAQLLDTRPPPQTDDPDAGGLPSTINPLQFLIDNVLGPAALVVRVRPAAFGPEAAGLDILEPVLRLLVPPQQATLVVEV